ncbi:MAG: cell division protein FtsL [Acidobacteria bacterium]|nr:cell division protein FtsL [Acidobacteriota bacterium]
MTPVPNRSPSPWRRLLLTLLGLALLALVVHTVFGEHGYLALARQREELKRLEQEIDRLEEENRRLAEEVQTLKSDPRAIERVAREQLKMARPGEKIITLPPEEPPAAESESRSKEKP